MHAIRHLQATTAVSPALQSSPVRALTAALALALALPLSAGSRDAVARPASPASEPIPSASTTWIVKNCDDDGVDSLREIIKNPAKAQSGDIVDLSELPTRCALTDAVITLASGEIAIAQGDLELRGPTQGSVTVSGGGNSRVFHHSGSGRFSLFALTIANGYYQSMGNNYGGCIQSDTGDIILNHSSVKNCRLVSQTLKAHGGGVSAESGDIQLVASVISDNEADGPGRGGGTFSGGVTVAKYSSISGNVAGSSGGGVHATSGATIFASTVHDNSAGYGGGLWTTGSTTILDSTISSNETSSFGSALATRDDALLIANTTISFNHQTTAGAPIAGGIWFKGDTSNGVLTLLGSIVANNFVEVGNAPTDIFVESGFGTLAGSDNLVVASNLSDPLVITLTSDPKLGPLALNGGPTKTHRLLPASPALSQGNNAAGATHDQRGIGYPRTTGPTASVDLGAVQFDAIFVDGLESPFAL